MSPGDVADDFDLLSKLTRGFYDSLPLSFHENSVHFALGHTPVVVERPPYEALGHSFTGVERGTAPLSYPKRITIRCGCRGTEDTGTRLDRTPGDYAIRLVQVHVMDR